MICPAVSTNPHLPFLRKVKRPIIDTDADPLGADIDPGLSSPRQHRACAVSLRHDRVVDIAHDARTRRNDQDWSASRRTPVAPEAVTNAVSLSGRRAAASNFGSISQVPSDRMKPRLPSIDATKRSSWSRDSRTSAQAASVHRARRVPTCRRSSHSWSPGHAQAIASNCTGVNGSKSASTNPNLSPTFKLYGGTPPKHDASTRRPSGGCSGLPSVLK